MCRSDYRNSLQFDITDDLLQRLQAVQNQNAAARLQDQELVARTILHQSLDSHTGQAVRGVEAGCSNVQGSPWTLTVIPGWELSAQLVSTR